MVGSFVECLLGIIRYDQPKKSLANLTLSRCLLGAKPSSVINPLLTRQRGLVTESRVHTRRCAARESGAPWSFAPGRALGGSARARSRLFHCEIRAHRAPHDRKDRWRGDRRWR